MEFTGFLVGFVAGLVSQSPGAAGELVLAADRHCDYQIVQPDHTPSPIIDRAITEAAETLREMFRANGFTVPLVRESQADQRKPGLYLGDTAAARAAGVDTSTMPVWAYAWKTAGKNVILAGRDWPAANRTQDAACPCSLGTVKGAADFMRRFCGTRFLAPGGPVGIEFLPMPRIAIPDNLDLRKEPMLSYNTGERPATDIASIALNLLGNVTTEYLGHTHQRAVPAEKFADTHPEYFALVGGQRIREHEHPWKKGVKVKEPHLCYANKEVQELIYQDMLRSFDAGYPEYLSLQADGFQPCTCDACKALFDTDDWGEKLWRLNKQWAERLLKDRPGKFLVVTSYTVTGKPPTSFRELPANMRVCVGAYEEAFKPWAGYTIPGGFVTYLHAWGGYHLCGYLPVRTPRYAENVVKLFDAHHVQGVALDSPPAIMWGLEGPTVYVYGRMVDDVQTNTAEQLVDEYLQAAYGPAVAPMTRFFEELHHTLEAYAEVFGVDNGSFQHYTQTDGRRVRYLTWKSKLRLIGFLYPPETLAVLEAHLQQAERTSGLPEKIRKRLALVRREFDYLKSTARVVHLYNAYQTRLDKSSLEQLLAEMEARQRMILSWYDRSREYQPGVYLQKPIAADWPMYIGGAGYYNTHLLANGGSYLSQPVPPFTWDLAAVRNAALLAPKSITARKTSGALPLDAPLWEKIPAERLGPSSLGAAAPPWQSEVKLAYDADALYVRFEGELPEDWAKPPAMERDDAQIVTGESFGLVLAPDNNPSRYYRFAGGPTSHARYDARHGFVEDPLDPRFDRDDVAWNPEWRYTCATAADGKRWSALLVLPFKALAVPSPAPGTEWKVNFGRVYQSRRFLPREESLWSSNPGATSLGDGSALGTLRFE